MRSVWVKPSRASSKNEHVDSFVRYYRDVDPIMLCRYSIFLIVEFSWQCLVECWQSPFGTRIHLFVVKCQSLTDTGTARVLFASNFLPRSSQYYSAFAVFYFGLSVKILEFSSKIYWVLVLRGIIVCVLWSSSQW